MTSTRSTTSYGELNAIHELDRERKTSFNLTEDHFLELQRRWITELSAQLDGAIEFAGSEPLVNVVAAAWHELAAERRTLRALLDAAPEHAPRLAAAMSRESRYLALAAGLADLDDPDEEVIAVGRRYLGLIRSGAPAGSGRISTSIAVAR